MHDNMNKLCSIAQVVSAYTSSLNGGLGAPAPLVMATSGADVLTQAVAAASVGKITLLTALSGALTTNLQVRRHTDAVQAMQSFVSV